MLSGCPSKEIHGKQCEIRKNTLLSPYYVQWEPVQKSTEAEIRSTHERIRGHEFHSILEQSTDEHSVLVRFKMKMSFPQESVQRLKKEQMLQIQ